MLGRVDEADAVIGFSEKGSSCFQAVQDAWLAFNAQFTLAAVESTVPMHQAHQSFGLVRIELVKDENPLRLRVGLEHLVDMRGKVCFGAGMTDRRAEDFACGYFEVGYQSLSPVADVFELAPFYTPRFHGQGWLFALQGLNPRLLVGTQHPHPPLV